MTESNVPSKSESFKHGELVALVKWWHDGDTVPEGWTPMGPFNRGEAIENQRLRAALGSAVNPHAFNCGFVRHPTAIKMMPADGCTCGVTALLEGFSAETTLFGWGPDVPYRGHDPDAVTNDGSSGETEAPQK